MTDHKSLLSLFKAEVKNTKVQRWAILISEFSLTIKYREWKNNIHDDMLSRLETAAVFDSLPDILATEQEQQFPDEWAQALDSMCEEYEIIEGKLYSCIPLRKGAANHPRLMTPLLLRNKVITEAHEEHRALFNTIELMRDGAVWPGIRKDIEECIGICPHCQANQGRARRAPMQITDTHAAPTI